MEENTLKHIAEPAPQEQFDRTVSDISPKLATRIKASDLSVFYNQFQALINVNIEVIANQITALIGPSGCGKSTFLRTLNRMNEIIPGARTQGSVLLDGQEIYGRGKDVIALRKRVGMVFQRPNPFRMSIKENIEYGPKLHGERNRKRLAEIVEHSLCQAALWDEVKDALHKSAEELSGGQQQRLCIARTLAVDPEVVLMDEPCSALDPNATYHIEQLMDEMRANYTIVIVTHNMQQAARVSDRTGFFLKGELVEFDSTDLIFSRPHDRRTEDYIQGRFG